MHAAHHHAKCILLMSMPFMYSLLYMLLVVPSSLVTEQSCNLPDLQPIRQTSYSTPADNSNCCV